MVSHHHTWVVVVVVVVVRGAHGGAWEGAWIKAITAITAITANTATKAVAGTGGVMMGEGATAARGRPTQGPAEAAGAQATWAARSES